MCNTNLIVEGRHALNLKANWEIWIYSERIPAIGNFN